LAEIVARVAMMGISARAVMRVIPVMVFSLSVRDYLK
jgi:hypothetical protein